MITAYHASNSRELDGERFDLSKSSTARNGDNQACGVHFSSAREIAEDYLPQSGALIEATIPKNLPDFYLDSDIDTYKQIMLQHIGEDRISDLVDEIEENIIGYSSIDDLESRIANALIIEDFDLIEEVNEYYQLDQRMKDELSSILDHSFELDETNCNHEKCYMMLASTLDCRQKASEKLVSCGIKGFKYRWGDIENHSSDASNFCIMDVDSIKIINVEPVQARSRKMRP